MTKSSTTVADNDRVTLAVEIVAAYVSNNLLDPEKIPKLLQDVYDRVSELSKSPERSELQNEPAVEISKSVAADYIVCLEDGKKLKMLKRYLRTHYDLSPEEYRRKWNLPADYPMTAPSYAKRRSQFAKEIGLGTAKNKNNGEKASRVGNQKSG